MAAEVVSTSAHAHFQAGLSQDIFSKARTSTSDVSSQSSSSSSRMGASSAGIGASTAGLTVSSILSVANETMPSPLRAPDVSWQGTSGLQNSGTWLTASGNFTFAASGMGFPFLPPLPTEAAEHAQAQAQAQAHVHSLTHAHHPAPVAQPSMPPATNPANPAPGWKQGSASSAEPSPLVPRTSVVRPQAMNNFYQCKTDSRGEQAMAFWRVHSAELVQYNDAFGQLLDIPASNLQEGFLWCNVQVVDQDMRVVSLKDPGNNALKAIQEFTNLVLAGTARYSQISFSFLSGRCRLRHMHVTMVAFQEDILWICSEIGAENNFLRPAPRRGVSAPALAGSTDSATTPVDANERKLVKVATRKKKPWDQNLVKFSLKKMRKRTKRSKSDSPIVGGSSAMST